MKIGPSRFAVLLLLCAPPGVAGQPQNPAAPATPPSEPAPVSTQIVLLKGVNASVQLGLQTNGPFSYPFTFTADPSLKDSLTLSNIGMITGTPAGSDQTTKITVTDSIGRVISSYSIEVHVVSTMTVMLGSGVMVAPTTVTRQAGAVPAAPAPGGAGGGDAKGAGGAAQPAEACPLQTDVNETLPVVKVESTDVDSNQTLTIKGSILKAPAGKVNLCYQGKLADFSEVNSNGDFTLQRDKSKQPQLKVGDSVDLQFVASAGGAAGGSAKSVKQIIGSCRLAGSTGTGTAPTLNLALQGTDQAKYSGTAKGSSGERVRICVDDAPRNNTAPVQADKFDGGTDVIAVAANDSITAQVCGKDSGDTKCPGPFGPVSLATPVKSALTVGSGPAVGQPPTSIVLGGVEYAGYSSQAQTTDGFFEILYQGVRNGKFPSWRGWTRIRLSSAAQPATNGVVSLISNPAGLTSFNYSSVGQALDFVAGTSYQPRSWKYWSLIAGAGLTTPLSSQDKPIEFTAPAAGTVECTLLVNRFSAAKGYNPSLSLNTTPGSTSCLAGNYQDVAFANQDRSSFFLKYGGGFRTWYPLVGCDKSATNCTPSYAAADFTIGQDAAITGGQLRRLVFKVDGMLPIKTGTSSLLYLFGSAYVRLQRDSNLPPLFLATPATQIAVPSPSVIVLPLVQPNRDYYRLGVGLNINQLWCKIYNSTCPGSSPDSAAKAAAPNIKSISPKTATAGATADLPLTVTGSNFAEGMTVQWNGKALNNIQFVSATQLTATIPKANLATKATFTVTVVTTAGDASNGATFTVN